MSVGYLEVARGFSPTFEPLLTEIIIKLIVLPSRPPNEKERTRKCFFFIVNDFSVHLFFFSPIVSSREEAKYLVTNLAINILLYKSRSAAFPGGGRVFSRSGNLIRCDLAVKLKVML